MKQHEIKGSSYLISSHLTLPQSLLSPYKHTVPIEARR